MTNLARIHMKVVAKSGYRADQVWTGITPEQYGQVVTLLEGRPLDLVLNCPVCHAQHIDAPDKMHYIPGTAKEWDNPPHKSHLCHECGTIWRPADFPTNGVEAVKTKGAGDSDLEYARHAYDMSRRDE